MRENSLWYLYLVRCANGNLYTGISTDVARRFAEHANNRGAKSLKGKGPLELVFSQAVGDHSTALRLEYRIKKFSKPEKEALIAKTRLLPELGNLG